MQLVVLVSVIFAALAGSSLAQTSCPTAPTTPGDRRLDKTKLVVTEFNTEWLFMTYSKAANCPGDGCAWKNASEALDHLESIASVIKQISADIFMLAEVEDCTTLNFLYDKVGDSTYKYYLVKGTDTATNQNVALFTRIDPVVSLARTEERVAYPIPDSKCNFDGDGDSGVSKHFYTRFEIENLPNPLVMIGAHLVAFPDVPSRCSQREAQATVIRDLASKVARQDGYNYIILGDFNDYDPSFKDTAGDVPISMALDIMKSDSSGDEVLTNAVSLIANQSSRWSSWYDENDNCRITPQEQTLIDHILLSPALVPLVEAVNIFHNIFPASCGSTYSDHWPVAVYLNLASNNIDVVS